MPGAKVEVMVLSSVVNILAVVLIILVAADSRDGLVKQSALISPGPSLLWES
jgi:hypothetical protein